MAGQTNYLETSQAGGINLSLKFFVVFHIQLHFDAEQLTHASNLTAAYIEWDVDQLVSSKKSQRKM